MATRREHAQAAQPSIEGGGGLYTVRYRHYDPSLARWLERDPLGYVDGMNLYEYVQSSSVNAMDPFGLSKGGIITTINEDGVAIHTAIWVKGADGTIYVYTFEGNGWTRWTLMTYLAREHNINRTIAMHDIDGVTYEAIDELGLVGGIYDLLCSNCTINAVLAIELASGVILHYSTPAGLYRQLQKQGFHLRHEIRPGDIVPGTKRRRATEAEPHRIITNPSGKSCTTS